MTFWRIALVLAVWLCVSIVAGCAASSPVHESASVPIPFRPPATVAKGPQSPVDDCVPGVLNFAVISCDVWRGACPTADGFRVLASAGVKTIIDLREDDESAEIPAGVRYVRLPVSAWKADCVDVARVLQAIDQSPKPVFIHCREGRDRTGLAVAAYRLEHGMSEADACQELRNFHVNPWWVRPIESRIHELCRQPLARPSQPVAALAVAHG
jgi:protein tyrosine phosphatase (PTP) superfamily phosphohydrolase (DUF442 family)